MTHPLTLSYLQQRIGDESLQNIDKLNLWGGDFDDISILIPYTNIKNLQMAKNKIKSLKQISKMKQLEELNIKQNNLKELKELQYLQELQQLRVLNLVDNPITQLPQYKEIVLQYCEKLQVLDGECIKEQISQQNNQKQIQNEQQDHRNVEEQKTNSEGKSNQYSLIAQTKEVIKQIDKQLEQKQEINKQTKQQQKLKNKNNCEVKEKEKVTQDYLNIEIISELSSLNQTTQKSSAKTKKQSKTLAKISDSSNCFIEDLISQEPKLEADLPIIDSFEPIRSNPEIFEIIERLLFMLDHNAMKCLLQMMRKRIQ